MGTVLQGLPDRKLVARVFAAARLAPRVGGIGALAGSVNPGHRSIETTGDDERDQLGPGFGIVAHDHGRRLEAG